MAAATTPTKKKPTRTSTPAVILHDTSAPAPAQAAQIALIIQSKLKVDSWQGVHEWVTLHGDPRSKVILTPSQQAVLDAYAHLLPYISRSPKRVVVACPECGRYGVSQTATSAKCIYTLGCPGKLVTSKLSATRARSAHR